MYYAREHLQQAYHKSSISSLCSEDPKMSEKMNEGMLIQGNIFKFSSQPFDKNLVNNGRVAPDEKNCDEPNYYVNIFRNYLTCSILCR